MLTSRAREERNFSSSSPILQRNVPIKTGCATSYFAIGSCTKRSLLFLTRLLLYCLLDATKAYLAVVAFDDVVISFDTSSTVSLIFLILSFSTSSSSLRIWSTSLDEMKFSALRSNVPIAFVSTSLPSARRRICDCTNNGRIIKNRSSEKKRKVSE